ncbi:MAG: hypothetical protein KBT03_12875 [Bacteroidales bacterium]|nr:hypothetical protein [Candidatus Scybalousia scybalohippi]
MAVFTYATDQVVTVNNPVLFNYSENCGCAVTHRDGSGLFTLHGGKRYSLEFAANLAANTANDELALAFSINGESIPGTRMISTPPAADILNTVSRCIKIKVPCGCCYNVAIKNIGEVPIQVEDAYLSIIKED